MGDQHQRAAKFEQALLQDFERGNIEIVGRLIQQQQVGGLEHQLRNEHPRSLAAGEVRDRLVELLAGEEKARCPGGDVDDAVLIDD